VKQLTVLLFTIGKVLQITKLVGWLGFNGTLK